MGRGITASKATHRSFYDPSKSYEENFDKGPFLVFDEEDEYTNTGEPKYTFLGKKVYSPFGIAAGSLLNSKYVEYALRRGFDVVIYKTQRTVPFQVNAFPNVLFVDVMGDLTPEKALKPLLGKTEPPTDIKKITITNSFGMPSKGPDFWVPDLKKAVAMQGQGQLVIASVVGTIKEGFGPNDYYNDFAKAAELAASTGVEAIEVNLSCPNVATEGVLCYTYDAVVEICKRVRERVGDTPLLVKMGYFSHEQNELLVRTAKAIDKYINAISTINTLPAPVVDENGEQALPGPNRLRSGLCGASVKWAGLEMVQKLDKIRKEHNLSYEIVGVGGVMSPQDFDDYRKAGANAVQSVTGAMWNPKLAAEVKQHLGLGT
jgi:dihydroorotate dehydrogenase (NAD+) catalytic subunit